MLCKCSMDYIALLITSVLLQYKQIFKVILFSDRENYHSVYLLAKSKMQGRFNNAMHLLPTKNNVLGSLKC